MQLAGTRSASADKLRSMTSSLKRVCALKSMCRNILAVRLRINTIIYVPLRTLHRHTPTVVNPLSILVPVTDWLARDFHTVLMYRAHFPLK